MKDRLAAWALRRAYGHRGDAAGGTLVWIDAKGEVRDLGAYAVHEVTGLAWAVGVAYRTSRVRGERTRLAGLRSAARRILVGMRGVQAK